MGILKRIEKKLDIVIKQNVLIHDENMMLITMNGLELLGSDVNTVAEIKGNYDKRSNKLWEAWLRI